MERKTYIRVKNEDGQFDLIMPITESDYVMVSEDENLAQKILKIDDGIERKLDAVKVGAPNGVATLDANGLVPLSQIPKEAKELRVVDNIAQLLAIEHPFEALSVFVKDATGDPQVKSGGAFYIYDGRQFIRTAQSDTMNVVVDFDNIENRPTTLAGYGITDAVNVNQLTKKSGLGYADKILLLNRDGDLDVDITGKSNSTSRLDTARKITLSGDVEGECLFDGGENVVISTLMTSKGIRPGTYTKLTVDDRGRIIGVDKLISSDIPNVDWSKIVGTPQTLKEYGITDQVMVRDKDQIMKGKLFLESDPIDDTQAVNKKYVDALVQGLVTKQSVDYCIDTNADLYGTPSIHGFQLKEGHRVLLINQTNRTENGIYDVKASGKWKRSEDADTNDEFVPGMFTFVRYGEYENCGFVLVNKGEITLGTTEIQFTQFSGASDILVGSGLKREGNVISLESFGTPGTYSKVTIDKHGRVIAAKKQITQDDIKGNISWNRIEDRPYASISALDDAVLKKHVHDNNSVLDKLSENEEGQLLYDGKQIATGPSINPGPGGNPGGGSPGTGGGGSIVGTLTHIGTQPSPDLAVGGFWFKTKI